MAKRYTAKFKFQMGVVRVVDLHRSSAQAQCKAISSTD
jgi:hypothetical protein